MQPGILSIQVEDESDMFHKFSLLKDHDINYVLPTQIGLNKGEISNERDRIHRRRDDKIT